MRAFDDIDKPDPELIRDCVHCGFCLATCPTYLVTGNELDSPRGRIYLMKSALEGEVAMETPLVKHLELCLGCLACETSCPSGVQYGTLIESAKSQIQRRYQKPMPESFYHSLLFSIFPYPKRLSLLLPFLYFYQKTGLKKLVESSGLLKRISNKFAGMSEILPEIKSPTTKALAHYTPAAGKRRYSVALLSGCVQSVLFPETNQATVRVLARNGCDVYVPETQGCCGALSIHSGRLGEGRNFAKQTIDLFSKLDVDAVIVNSAGCGSTMKEYENVLKDDPQYIEKAQTLSNKTKDIMEFLSEIGLPSKPGRLELEVTYQDACHIAHGQRITEQPREVLGEIPGLKLVEMAESAICCGSAGIYNLVEPEMSRELLDRKITNLEDTGVTTLTAGNPGCLLQIKKGIDQKGLKIETLHPIELLDRAYK